MAVTIADITFEYHDYDRRGDTLYLGVDGPSDRLPEDSYDTPEGHYIELDGSGAIRAIELMNPRRLLERDGELRITFRERPTVACSSELAKALA